MEYCILTRRYSALLEEDVTQRLTDGWELRGNLVAIIDDNVALYIQTMTKE